MKTKLNPVIVEDSLKMRKHLLQIADLIGWIYDMKPDLIKLGMKEFGEKEVKSALNALENHVKIWRG